MLRVGYRLGVRGLFGFGGQKKLTPSLLPIRRSSAQMRISVRPEMAPVDRSLHLVPNNTPVCQIDCSTAFKNLSQRERLYAHHIARASFEGSLIIFLQVSPESPAIFVTLHRLFSSESISSLKEKALASGWTDDEWTNFLVYSAVFYSNSGNYKGFGDSKFVPSVAPEKLRALLASSVASSSFPSFLSTYDSVASRVFSLDSSNVNLGFPESGVTTYHSDNITKEDNDLVNAYLKSKGLEAWNTRLFKNNDGFIIKLASTANGTNCEDVFNGKKFVIEKGDYSPLLARVCDELTKAAESAANETQRQMLEKYCQHFQAGDINDHKDGSRFWIKDVNPVVESYIGFIENYRDPAGVRSEWEGFVAAVNKETSRKFAVLVDQAEEILQRLPWGKQYEKDTFSKPDFTALEIIAFGSSGMPAGINIPNYDEIRMNEGFKNVCLSNVIAALPKQKMNFITEEDADLIFTYNSKAFEVQVGLHELLGHGSGKLFMKNADGTFNFDKDATKDLLTGKPVTSWYEPGETWSSKFGALASSYEECRAEAVGYVLCCDLDILKIFGYEGDLAQTVKYTNWLSEIRAGLMALEFYNAEQQKWGQAHCHARYALLMVCLEAGQGFVTIDTVKDENGLPDLKFSLDRNKIESVGKPAVMEFLKKLQAYKATGDFAGGKALFDQYGSVSERELAWRDICIARRRPRRIDIQSNTKLTSTGEVYLVTYPENAEGVIQSFVERYQKDSIDDLETLWKEDQKHFPKAYAQA